MEKNQTARLRRRREILERGYHMIPESFGRREDSDDLVLHEVAAEDYYAALRPHATGDNFAMAHDEAAILAYAAHLFGDDLVFDFVDAATEGRDYGRSAGAMSETFGGDVIAEIATAIRERAQFDFGAAPSVPRLAVDNTRERESAFDLHRGSVDRAFAALPEEAATAVLRPLWAAMRQDSEARLRRQHPAEDHASVAALAMREAHVLQSIADRFGDEMVANVVNAVGEYRVYDEHELDAAKRALFGGIREIFPGDHAGDVGWTILSAMRLSDDIAA